MIVRGGRWGLPSSAAALALGLWGGAAGAGPWDESYFPNVPLLTQEGETVRFYDDLIEGRIVVVTFVYTDCPDICGLSTARLAQVVDWLGDRVGRDIFVYSISLDPETDTPERLKAYADAFGAGPGWTFLTGTRENIDLVRYKMGERSQDLSEHRSDMVIGNGATGQWRRSSLMGSLVVATTEILELDPSWTPPKPEAAAAAPDETLVVKDTRGEGLFITACAACHAIGEGVRIGPDLAGVTLRRDRAWLETFLRDPSLMLENGDPTAVALDASFPAIRMPDLGLGPNDVADLIHYFDSQTVLLGEPMAEAAEEGGHDHAGHHHHHASHEHDAPAEGHDHGAHIAEPPAEGEDHGVHVQADEDGRHGAAPRSAARGHP